MKDALSPPTTISHYRVLSRLGSGGMGTIYLAEDTRLGRKVALKLLPEALAQSQEWVARLEQEARAVSSLSHPNILTVFEIEKADGLLFIVTEFVEGETLRARLIRGRMATREVLDVAVQVAAALSAAHAARIVHRDVKPDNVMLRPDGYVKVLDFGLAKLVDSPPATMDSDALTQVRVETEPGTVLGTVRYMSPEQARGQAVDARTDIFSLGVVLYEMVSGVSPFAGATNADVLASILKVDPEPLARVVPGTPSELERIVEKALRKDREQRYQTIQDMLVDLKILKQQLDLEAGRERSRPPEGALLAPKTESRPKTRYARSGDVNIAYQVVGSGPLDLVYVMGWVTNLDYFWEEPAYARFLRRLAAHSRLILFDKRGTGLSDRVHESELPTLEQRMDDVRAVMDAVGSAQAAVFGVSEGGPMSALFAATYPKRVSALVMFASYAKRVWDPEYPWAPTPEQRQEFFDLIQEGWGGVVDLATVAPSMANNAAFREWWAAYLRRSASPGAALALARMNTEIDIRHVLPAIRVPTLIVHRTGDLDIDVGGSRYMARQIPGARYVELPGSDHLPWVGDQDAILEAVEGFLQNARHAPLDRVLATVLFIQVVDPESAAGPHLLERYRALAKGELERFRGREMGVTGGGYLATFDGPARAIRAASLISEGAVRQGLQMRAGLHTGECDVIDDRLGGVAVEIGSQVAARARAGEVWVSSTAKDLVAGSGIQFADRGSHRLTGIEGEWKLFAVER
ncbi:MAG TPA: alpha/beta fold hydrolase [Vicinamibacteria bacterium]|nr:alpha/beta fold hydrolase [Vicinamibacteria bacterium]